MAHEPKWPLHPPQTANEGVWRTAGPRPGRGAHPELALDADLWFILRRFGRRKHVKSPSQNPFLTHHRPRRGRLRSFCNQGLGRLRPVLSAGKDCANWLWRTRAFLCTIGATGVLSAYKAGCSRWYVGFTEPEQEAWQPKTNWLEDENTIRRSPKSFQRNKGVLEDDGRRL